MGRSHGFTLWELICTLGLTGVIVALATPSFSDFVLDARRTADINGFVLAVQLARSEAAKRGRSVIVCATTDLAQCSPRGESFKSGWMVYVNSDEQYPPQRTREEPLLYAHTAEMVGTITSNRAFYEFRVGRRSTNGTVVFCDRRGVPAARSVIVSYTGRPRVSPRNADGQALECADLT